MVACIHPDHSTPEVMRLHVFLPLWNNGSERWLLCNGSQLKTQTDEKLLHSCYIQTPPMKHSVLLVNFISLISGKGFSPRGWIEREELSFITFTIGVMRRCLSRLIRSCRESCLGCMTTQMIHSLTIVRALCDNDAVPPQLSQKPFVYGPLVSFPQGFSLMKYVLIWWTLSVIKRSCSFFKSRLSSNKVFSVYMLLSRWKKVFSVGEKGTVLLLFAR